MTIKKWLPELRQYIFGQGARPPIKVIYAQQALLRPGAPEPACTHEWDNFSLMKRDAMCLALEEVDSLYRISHESWCSSTSTRQVSRVISIGNDEAEMRSAELATFSYAGWQRAASMRPLSSKKRDRASSVSKSSGTRKKSASKYASGPAAISAEPSHPPYRSPRPASMHAAVPRPQSRPVLKCLKYPDVPNLKELITQLEETVDLLPWLAGLGSHARFDFVVEKHSCKLSAMTPRHAPGTPLPSSTVLTPPQVDRPSQTLKQENRHVIRAAVSPGGGE